MLIFFLVKITNFILYVIGYINNDWREEMKKLLIALSVLFIMSGCDEKTESLSCSSTTTANGITTKTIYNID